VGVKLALAAQTDFNVRGANPHGIRQRGMKLIPGRRQRAIALTFSRHND